MESNAASSSNIDCRHVESLVASLLDFFRDPKEELNYRTAAKIAWQKAVLLGAPPSLQKRFLFFTQSLKNNISCISLRRYAQECYSALASQLPLKSPNSSEMNDKALQKKARRELELCFASGHQEAASIERTAQELAKNHRLLEQKRKLLALAQSHPLRESFFSCQIGQKPLPKEDVKSHFLRLKKTGDHGYKTSLLSLLQKAQSFSTTNLHRLLGDELFFLCRPLGFLEKSNSIVVIEVPTNAHLHALAYKKLEILKSLKKDLAFCDVKTIRFQIKRATY